MKFTKEFKEALKNFNTINPGIVFVPGKVQTTISNLYNNVFTFLARVNSDVEITDTFAVDSISKLLNIIELFEEPEIIYDNKRLIIKDNKNEVILPTFRPEFIPHEPNPSKYKPAQEGYKFDLPWSIFHKVFVLAGTLGHDYITFGADGENFYVMSCDIENPTTSSAKLFLEATTENFKVVVEKKMINILKSDYSVLVTKRYIYMTNSVMEYFMTLKSGYSTFN